MHTQCVNDTMYVCNTHTVQPVKLFCRLTTRDLIAFCGSFTWSSQILRCCSLMNLFNMDISLGFTNHCGFISLCYSTSLHLFLVIVLDWVYEHSWYDASLSRGYSAYSIFHFISMSLPHLRANKVLITNSRILTLKPVLTPSFGTCIWTMIIWI